MTINLRKLLEAGHAANSVAKAAKEAAVAGHPRVGTVGAVTADGKVYGACHRKALARSFGIEEEVGTHTRIMWGAGERHEDGWLQLLRASGTDLVIMHQHEVNTIIEGVPKAVLGHPDIVLAELVLDGSTQPTDVTIETGNIYDAAVLRPVLGIEHKGVFSYNTAATVYLDNRPKNDNLIQAAAYSHFLKLPYELWYTNANYFSTSYDKKKYGIGTIEPFYKGFKLEWRDDVLWYQPEDSAWVKTPVTGQGIEDYYRLVAEMPVQKDLGPRPEDSYLDGSPHKWAHKGPNNDCKFCPFAAACDQYDSSHDYDEWLDGIKLISQTKDAT